MASTRSAPKTHYWMWPGNTAWVSTKSSSRTPVLIPGCRNPDPGFWFPPNGFCPDLVTRASSSISPSCGFTGFSLKSVWSGHTPSESGTSTGKHPGANIKSFPERRIRHGRFPDPSGDTTRGLMFPRGRIIRWENTGWDFPSKDTAFTAPIFHGRSAAWSATAVFGCIRSTSTGYFVKSGSGHRWRSFTSR